MLPTNPILREVFPKWAENKGIFDLMDSPPWGNDPDSSYLNLSYFGNHSGAKFCSPLVRAITVDSTLSDTARQTLVKVIEAKYKINWQKLWETMVAEYSPITNYDMTENITRSLETKDGSNETTVKSSNASKELTRNTVDSTDHGMTTTENDSLYGFNSETAKPSNKVETSEGGTTSEKHTGTDKTEELQNDNGEVTKTGSGTEKETTTTKRVGNIGITTNQQLIREERDLWIWNYFDSVFRDIDRELALAFYDPCRV